MVTEINDEFKCFSIDEAKSTRYTSFVIGHLSTASNIADINCLGILSTCVSVANDASEPQIVTSSTR
ncbi:hypothetical protein L208DRAFT_1406294 [Tricholoma matsutake]|nr:hypothetical protein L208DRAFT_1406294 [Tricholoma matsutake 945]